MNTSLKHIAESNQRRDTSALLYGMKREYWEHKRMLVTIPIIVSAIFFLMAIMATWSEFRPKSSAELDNQSGEMNLGAGSNEGDHKTSGVENSDKINSEADFAATDTASVENLDNQGNTPLNLDEAKSQVPEQQGDGGAFWFSGVYLVAAWLAAMFYALSSLYSDRRDKSILYWKTMPVAEIQTVVAKFLFAILGFSMVAIFVSWVTAAVLLSYAYAVFPPLMMEDGAAGMNFTKLVIWPLLTVIIALPWCAPVFALLLLVSATAKKMPIVSFIVPVIVVRVIERVVFGSDHLYNFFHSHSPLGLVAGIAEMQNTGELLSIYFFESMPSLVVGLVLTAGLLWRAAWLRDNAFEI